MTIPFALAAAVLWGLADFMGGVTSRRLSPLVVVMWVNAVGFVATAFLTLVLGASMSESGALWSVAAGFASGGAFVIFYAALTTGPMSVVAPISACGAIVPALVGVAGGDEITALLAVGLVAALSGAVLAARASPSEEEEQHVLTRRALGLAVAAALAIGCLFTLMQQATNAPDTDPLAVLAISRCVGLAVCLSLVIFRSAPPAVPSELWRNVLIVGLGDTAANACFTIASDSGEETIAAVLSSLYPVATVVLASLLLHERLGRIQLAGVALALAGVAAVSAA